MQIIIKPNNEVSLMFRAIMILAIFAVLFSTFVSDALARSVDSGTLNNDVSGQSNSTLCSTLFSGSYQYKVIFPNETLVGHKDPHASTAFGNIPAGDYKVTILTLDSYADRKNVSQPSEQLYLSVGGSDTGLTSDLPDYAVTGYSIDSFDNIKLNYDVSSMVAKHISYKGVSGPNSVRPVCAIFEPKNIPNPDPELTASCSANPSSVMIDNSVNWTASVSGGNGNYSYLWSGTDGLSGDTKNISKVYNSIGTKTASVTIKSNGQTVTRTCNATVTSLPVPTSLNVSCSVDDSSVDVDEDVRYTANVSGGNGNYVYNWSGTDGVFNTNRSFNWSYDDTGTKRTTVTVFSGSESVSDTCSVKVNDNSNNDNLSVSCYADDSSVMVGDRVRWIAEVDGDDGDIDYDWSGDDGLDSSSKSPSMYYNTPGTKEAEVRVRSNGDSDTARCTVRVSGNTVLSYSQYNPNNQVLDAVYLNEVPYTGLADNKGLIWFIVGLLLVSAYLAYIFIAYKKNFGPNRHQVHNK